MPFSRSRAIREDAILCRVARTLLSCPDNRDVLSRAQRRVRRHQRQRAIETMRRQHAVERIATVPVERARGLRIRGVDRERLEAGVRRRPGALLPCCLCGRPGLTCWRTLSSS